MERTSLETDTNLDTVEMTNDRAEVIHTFYLSVNGNIFIDKHTCNLLKLGEKYNLVLVKDNKTESYTLEIRDPLDNSYTLED